MKLWVRRVVVGCAVMAAVGAVAMLAFLPDFDRRTRGAPGHSPSPTDPEVLSKNRLLKAASPASPQAIPLFSAGFIDDSGWDLALSFTPPILARSSLSAVRTAARQRVERGLAELQARLAQIDAAPRETPGLALGRHRVQMMVGLLFMYQGQFAQATDWFEKALTENGGLPPELRANTEALLGIAALRQGEVDNCVACLGPSSCIFPIAREAVHQRTEGSREAVRRFTAYLGQRPDDLGIRWLLNVASMTLGEYPAQVPPQYLIPLKPFEST